MGPIAPRQGALGAPAAHTYVAAQMWKCGGIGGRPRGDRALLLLGAHLHLSQQVSIQLAGSWGRRGGGCCCRLPLLLRLRARLLQLRAELRGVLAGRVGVGRSLLGRGLRRACAPLRVLSRLRAARTPRTRRVRRRRRVASLSAPRSSAPRYLHAGTML